MSWIGEDAFNQSSRNWHKIEIRGEVYTEDDLDLTGRITSDKWSSGEDEEGNPIQQLEDLKISGKGV